MDKPKLTLREIIFEGIKKFAGEIIGVVLLACFLWFFPSLKSLFTEHTFTEKNESQSEIQRELEQRVYRVDGGKASLSGKASHNDSVYNSIELLDQTSCHDRQDERQQDLSDISPRQIQRFGSIHCSRLLILVYLIYYIRSRNMVSILLNLRIVLYASPLSLLRLPGA